MANFNNRFSIFSQFSLFMMLALQPIHAQHLVSSANPKIFEKIRTPNGGYVGAMTGITQDKDGYLWMASPRGLFRYDGYKFKLYLNDPYNSNSIASNHLETVLADRDGIIWIATWINGLDRLDPATEEVKHYRHNPADPFSISNDTLRAILEDREGNLWIGNYGGLERLDRKTGKFYHYSNRPGDSTSLSCNRVRRIYEDRQNTLWIGTGSVWEGGELPEGGLNRMNRKSGEFTRYMHNDQDPHSLVTNKVQSIFEDSRGIFYVGTSGDGLHIMDREKGIFQRMSYDPRHPEKLSRPALRIDVGVDVISFITEDSLQNLWIGTVGNGISKYDFREKKNTHFGSENNQSGFEGNSVFAAFNSSDGTLWISNFVGYLYRISPFKQLIPYIITSVYVSAICTAPDSMLWIGNFSGLAQLDKKTGKIKENLLEESNPMGNLQHQVNSIYKDDGDSLWIGTNRGIVHIKNALPVPPARERIRFAWEKEILPPVTTITGNGKDSLWIGTDLDLELVDLKAGKVTHFQSNPSDSNSLGLALISTVLRDPSGNIWIGSNNSPGLDYYDLKRTKFTHLLKGLAVIAIFQDSQGNLWAGTDDGLYKIDRQLIRAAKYEFPGKIIPGAVASIGEDKDGNLWMGTSIGICRVNFRTDQTKIFAAESGVNPDELGTNVYYNPKEDQLYFSGFNGLYILSPSSFARNQSPPKILITDLRVSGKSILPEVQDILDSTGVQKKPLALKYNQNDLTIDFVGPNYRNAENNRYQYQLENYEQVWHEAGSERTAYYYKLPPGKYIFHVRVSGNDGIWAQKNLDIVISPPFWQTWWFYLVEIWTFVSLVYWVYRYEKLKVISRERKRASEKELQHAKEIEKAYHELRGTQAQLIQQEKMASLGEVTAGIAHEIQNPLNFVNNFSEVNAELIEEMRNELQTGNAEAADAIANTIRDNNVKISHHGKRADTIVKGMLQHTRSGGGHAAFTDINQLAGEYLNIAYHGFRARDKDFRVRMTKDFNSQIQSINTVPQELGRVLLNLFNNAFYAANEKDKLHHHDYEPAVHVHTRQSGQHLEIEVEDNGLGISSKIMSKIFQPFYTTKPSGQGTGLGLSLSYDIIKSLGGEIKVESAEGEYAKFIVLLPMTKE